MTPVGPAGLPADNHIELPIFETVLNGTKVLGSIVGTRMDLQEVFELHAAGKTHPVNTPAAFHSLCPCRITTRRYGKP